MSEADKMFEEMGYEKSIPFERYSRKTQIFIKCIYFNLTNQKIDISLYNKNKNEYEAIRFTKEELKQ